MPRREKLSSVDTAWLRMEHPTNLMMISGVMIFGGRVDFENLLSLLEERLLVFERFRQRVIEPFNPLSPPYWETVEDFEIEDHLYRFTPPVKDQKSLQRLAGRLMSTQLDFSKPLWEFHFIENYRDGDSALFCRLHHSIADGIALIRVLLSITDESPDQPKGGSEGSKVKGDRRGFLSSLYRASTSPIRQTQKVSKRLIHESMVTFKDPVRLVDYTKTGLNGALALARITLRPPDPKTIFKGRLNVSKKAAWSEPVLLKDVKALGKATGGTVNDVLLTAMTGALRRYLLERGQDVEGLNFRAAVPVNLRPLDGPIELGNKFGLVFLSLPVGVEDPIDRLYELKMHMDELKGSPEAVIAFGILNAMGMAPSQIENLIVEIFGAKITSVMTNVPGPKKTIYVAGQPLRDIMFWVPQSGRVGLGISIISYDGHVLLGVATDEGLVPDPERIVEAFQTEFEDLKFLVEQGDFKLDRVIPTRKTVRDLHHQLENLEKLVDQLGSEHAESPSRCQALTKSGQRCRNRAQTGLDYCYVHNK